MFKLLYLKVTLFYFDEKNLLVLCIYMYTLYTTYMSVNCLWYNGLPEEVSVDVRGEVCHGWPGGVLSLVENTTAL